MKIEHVYVFTRESGNHDTIVKLSGDVSVELRLPAECARRVLDIVADYAVDSIRAASNVTVHQIVSATNSLEHNPEVF
jgi:hypothetical protein